MTDTFVAALHDAGPRWRKSTTTARSVVTGLTSAEIGELAPTASSPCTSFPHSRASLEDAFMELTHDAVEFRTHEADRSHDTGSP